MPTKLLKFQKRVGPSEHQGIKIVKVHWVRRYKAGYILRKEDWQSAVAEPIITIVAAYNLNYEYLGSAKDAYFLCVKKGIVPQKITPLNTICTIGYCAREGKWYGWSHRAIYGFKTKAAAVKFAKSVS